MATKSEFINACAKHVGRVIKFQRKQSGYTQYSLGKEIDRVVGSISGYESGQTDIPLSSMASISYALEFHPSHYFAGIQDYFGNTLYESPASDYFKYCVRFDQIARHPELLNAVVNSSESTDSDKIQALCNKQRKNDMEDAFIDSSDSVRKWNIDNPCESDQSSLIGSNRLTEACDDDNIFFNQYINSQKRKKQMLFLMWNIFADMDFPDASDKRITSLNRSVINFISYDHEEKTAKRLGKYVRAIRKSINKGL